MHDNLRAAQRWLVEAGDAERGLRLSGRLGYYWYYRGHPAEGRAWLAEVLALPRASARTPGRGRALAARPPCWRGSRTTSRPRGRTSRRR